MEEPPDPGGTIPPGSVNVPHIPSKMDILISAVESSMDTDTSIVSNVDKTLKRKIFSSVCVACNKRKRKIKTPDGKARYNCDCKCDANTIKLQNPPNTTTDKIPTVTTNPNITTRVPIGRAQYQVSDNAPFVVHVQKEGEVDSATSLHPITFGRFLKQNNFNGIVNGSLKRVGRNRISMTFSTFMDANNFLLNKNLEIAKYKAFIPTFNVTRMGVVKGVPLDWSDEEVLSSMTVPLGCGPIIKIRRIKRKVITNNASQFINTGTVIITFDGQVLPTRVYMCYTALPVELYIYPTVQCYQCCRFGHVKNQCRSMPKCYKCGQGHSGETCQVEEEDYRCCLCKGSHQAVNKKCLEHNRQRAIKETMSKSCISYMEAIKMHPPVSKLSYAEALFSTPMSPSSKYNPSTSDTNSAIPNSVSQSYKKTVYAKPRSPSKLSKGYDRFAHLNIIKDPVLPTEKPINNNHNNENTMKIADIIKFLIQLLSQSNLVSPSHVASVIEALCQIQNINNGSQSQSGSMELSKSQN